MSSGSSSSSRLHPGQWKEAVEEEEREEEEGGEGIHGTCRRSAGSGRCGARPCRSCKHSLTLS